MLIVISILLVLVRGCLTNEIGTPDPNWSPRLPTYQNARLTEFYQRHQFTKFMGLGSGVPVPSVVAYGDLDHRLQWPVLSVVLVLLLVLLLVLSVWLVLVLLVLLVLLLLLSLLVVVSLSCSHIIDKVDGERESWQNIYGFVLQYIYTYIYIYIYIYTHNVETKQQTTESSQNRADYYFNAERKQTESLRNVADS